jgi:formamidopyrimidine-DNA glycosylase
MPELPEVQTIVDGLNGVILHDRLVKLEILNKKTLSNKDGESLIGQKLKNIFRIGKYIILDFDSRFLVVHLRMTGQFFYFPQKSEFESKKSDRVYFYFSKGILVFRDIRKFGTMKVVTQYEEALPKLGIDPLSKEFTQEALSSLLSRSKSILKSFLLRQDSIAGLGNIYVDEALYHAGIHPLSVTSKLSLDAIKKLHHSIIHVLKKGLQSGGTSLGGGIGNYKHVNGEGKNQEDLLVYGRKNGLCKVCHHALEKQTIAGRGTTFCPNCQKRFY